MLGELGRLQFYPGSVTLRSERRGSKSFLSPFGYRFFRDCEAFKTRFTADSALRTIGGHKIGFIGIAGAQALEEADAYTEGALALRRQGAELVIALVGLSGSEGEALASQINGADIIVIGGRDRVTAPRVIEGSLVVESASQGSDWEH